MTDKAAADPALTPAGVRLRAADYAACSLAGPLVGPVFAELTDLPPLVIQAGSHEVLPEDAIRLAARAATADVQVTLEVPPGAPHVFQLFAALLDEADAALNSRRSPPRATRPATPPQDRPRSRASRDD